MPPQVKNIKNALEELYNKWDLFTEIDRENDPLKIHWLLADETYSETVDFWNKNLIKPFTFTTSKAPEEHPEILELLNI